MRGEVRFESSSPRTAALQYAKSVGNELREAKPGELHISGSRVFVRGGIFRFVSSWNLLVAVTSATIDVIADENHVTVRYDVKVTELLLSCAAFTALGVAKFWNDELLIPVLVMIWGWLFGMNYLVMRLRITSMLRRVAMEVANGAKPS